METDRNLLVRYFSGECSEEEKTAIRQWLEQDETHKSHFIRERIRFDASLVIDENELTTVRSFRINRITGTVLKIASIVLLVIGSSYVFTLYRTIPKNTITQNIYVPAGNRTSLTLPDGTRVWLNSNTTLLYPNIFNGRSRMVELDGEAWFEVARDNKKRFIVKTNKYNVEVLGTTFNMEAYSNKPAFKVALFTGKLRLYKEQEEEELILNTGETAELIDNSLRVSSTDANSYRWKDGLIIMEDKSFEEIMHLFEKYFGQQIIIENDKVKELGYHGKLRIADGVDHALRVLQNDFQFTYKRDEDTNMIYIY